MAGTKTDVPASMQEGLQTLLPDIASIMGAPDADMAFLTKLQQAVLLRIHQPKPGQPPAGQPGAGAAGAGGPGAGAAGPSAPPPGAGGAPGGQPGGLPGMGLPGGQPGGGSPNQQMMSGGAPEAPSQPGGVGKSYQLPPDEIRRMLAVGAGE